jgi:hypothetical protein
MQHSRLKQSAILSGVVALGLLVLAVLALDVEISFLHVVREQKRTWVLPGTGVVCLPGSSVGALVARSKAPGMVLSLVFVLGVMALVVGLYFLTVLGFHGRADLGPGVGTVCLMGGIVGTIVARSSALVTGHEILRAKTPAALALALTEEQELQPTEGEQSS